MNTNRVTTPQTYQMTPSKPAFRCGTPLVKRGLTSAPTQEGENTVQRRKDYGEAIRRHTARPQTAQEFIGNGTYSFISLKLSFLK